MPERITVVGVPGNEVPPADVYAGGRRHLGQFAPDGARTIVIGGDVGAALDGISEVPGTVCVLASGDPGFFGIVRALAERFGPEQLAVRPAPSSVSLAFARLGLAWDDATVVSAHGRPLGDAARAVVGATKAAVLVSPELPPEALGKELLTLGAAYRQVAVGSRLGLAGEAVVRTDLAGLAGGTWDPLSVVVLWDRDDAPSAKTLAWGLPDARFAHRAGMVTKAEVRAVALGKLALPSTGVVWDVGAGSGSVAIECARLCPALQVYAVERVAADAERIIANAAEHEVDIAVRCGEAPAALDDLPDPDRAFVGGGGIAVLDAVIARLRPGGTVVATYAAIDRAAEAARRLGSLVQVGVARGERLPDGSFRLAAENPVFVAWGPG
ncbi:MAG: precorrin-6B C5,15-methyltransferase / cobalt-precorrin-6B C5,C15-methyltransferase [Acidimicrobiaceae bacterium]|nr:precorrin-6B C5,15-methyltransferase / cobalt-precorrin-6B C5,C15-methyltransferase [Acidimicrobiaceae bacterium]